MTSKRCPHCHQLLPPKPRLNGVKLSSLQSTILDAVYRAGPHGITVARLADLIYSGDPNGGPLTALNSIRVTIYNMNKRLSEVGLLVRAPRGGNGSFSPYTLRRIARRRATTS